MSARDNARTRTVAESFLSTTDASEIALLDELVEEGHARKEESRMIPGLFVYWPTQAAKVYVHAERSAKKLIDVEEETDPLATIEGETDRERDLRLAFYWGKRYGFKGSIDMIELLLKMAGEWMDMATAPGLSQITVTERVSLGHHRIEEAKARLRGALESERVNA